MIPWWVAVIALFVGQLSAFVAVALFSHSKDE